jgi:predicted RNA-binding Zn ribbon-like protein
LVEFARSAATLSRPEARRLSEEATRQPARAATVLRRAIALREAIWRVFDAFAKSARAEAADFATIHEEELAAIKHARFEQSGSDVADQWSDELSLDRPLWDIARAAAELLRSKVDRARVRECGSDTCEWLFIDRSRNHSRRWCDMNDCGNAAKVRRFRQRRHAPTKKASR